MSLHKVFSFNPSNQVFYYEIKNIKFTTSHTITMLAVKSKYSIMMKKRNSSHVIIDNILINAISDCIQKFT